jgi:hypothetical protein
MTLRFCPWADEPGDTRVFTRVGTLTVRPKKVVCKQGLFKMVARPSLRVSSELSKSKVHVVKLFGTSRISRRSVPFLQDDAMPS